MQCPYVKIKKGFLLQSDTCYCTSTLNPSVQNGDGSGYVAWRRCVRGEEYPDGVDFTKCMYYTRYGTRK